MTLLRLQPNALFKEIQSNLFTGLEIANDTVANATNIFSLAT